MKTLFNSMFIFFLTVCSSLPLSLVAENNATTAKEIVFVLAPTDFKNADRAKRAKEYNAELKDVLEKYWELDFGYKLMQRKEAYKYAKTDNQILVGEFGTMNQVNGIRTETTFEIYQKRKKILSVRLPPFILSKIDMVYAVMHAQFMYKNLTKFKNPSKELPKKYGHILKKKTLLIAKGHLANRFTENDLKKVYPYNYKIVPYSEIEEAIINKDENYVVLYKASEAGNVTEANYPYWNIYQPNDGVVITRHGGGTKGLSKADVALFVKRTK